jgi:hypothetical protein
MWSIFIMIRNISCTINGKSVTLVVDVRQSLIEVLRENGYTSVKEGCGIHACIWRFGSRAAASEPPRAKPKMGIYPLSSRPIWIRGPYSAASARPD